MNVIDVFEGNVSASHDRVTFITMIISTISLPGEAKGPSCFTVSSFSTSQYYKSIKQDVRVPQMLELNSCNFMLYQVGIKQRSNHHSKTQGFR